jgi:hypothetical protein
MDGMQEIDPVNGFIVTPPVVYRKFVLESPALNVTAGLFKFKASVMVAASPVCGVYKKNERESLLIAFGTPLTLMLIYPSPRESSKKSTAPWL